MNAPVLKQTDNNGAISRNKLWKYFSALPIFFLYPIHPLPRFRALLAITPKSQPVP